MSFISYAQNCEDVMLWRALKHVQNGFYIDVGANDPVVDSVTKAFYDRGWRGINIEPLASHHQDLSVARPDDINLRCAAGSKRGKTKIWECDVRGWATASRQVIRKHEQDGHKGLFHSVYLVQLADICEQYVTNEIHFLKIDVEGLEEDVLKGMNFKKFRPWIILIEATRPSSTEEIHQSWEELILTEDYVLAYADGLNRFYASKEQASKLIDVLRYPPNVFDGYMRAQQLESELRAQRAETDLYNALAVAESAQTQAQKLSDQLEQTKVHVKDGIAATQAIETAYLQQIKTVNDELEAVRQELRDVHQANHHHWELAERRQKRINALLNSSSWRITAPLRWPAHQQRSLRHYGLRQRVKDAVKKAMRMVLPWVVTDPKLKAIVKKVAYKLGVAHRIKPFVQSVLTPHQQTTQLHTHQQVTVDTQTLTPRARQIYHDLKQAIENKQKGEA